MPETVIAAPSTIAAETGAAVVEAGGSVVDAAIAATLTAMCTEPGVCAPGGGGYFTVWMPGEDPVSIDGYMAMPGRGLDRDRKLNSYTVSMEYGGGVSTDVGPASIAVPGGLAAMEATHQRWGRMPWKDVIGAVADALVDGFPLPAACRYYLGFSGEPVFAVDPVSRAALFDGSRLRDTGEPIVVEGLTETLRHIAEAGASSFYRGDLAATIAGDLADRGSRLTRYDLADYQAIVRDPVVSQIGDWTVATTPPPAIGGVTLSAILRLVATSDSPLSPSTWASAQAVVLGRHRPTLEAAADREAAGWDLLDAMPSEPRASGSTVSIAVADQDGALCTATMSGGYGSGVIPSGTGLWMNNSLGEIELNPLGIDRIAPGTRLMSNMAPTVVAGPGRRISIGSPGADRITSALATAITLIVNGSRLEDAVEHPRLHYENSARISAEPGLVVEGYDVVEYEKKDMYFGGVTAAETGDEGLSGHADSRRTGGVAHASRD